MKNSTTKIIKSVGNKNMTSEEIKKAAFAETVFGTRKKLTKKRIIIFADIFF